jgi:hypothetical protein
VANNQKAKATEGTEGKWKGKRHGLLGC